jgi:hypothetical protein
MMEIVVSIAECLNHHVDIIGRAYVLIVWPFTNTMPNAVNCKRIIEINAESSNHTRPIGEF